MRVAVIGCGSIGLRHIRNLVALGHSVEAVDELPRATAEALMAGADCDRTRRPQATIQSMPTDGRFSATRPTFYEKPLARTVADAECLNSGFLVHLIQCGYQLRFDAGIARLRADLATFDVAFASVRFSQRLDEWQPNRDYRLGPYIKTGIVLEASHELDLIRYLFGEVVEVVALVGRRSDLDLSVEDTAFAAMRMESGALVTLHLDMVRSGYDRSIEVVSKSGAKLHWRYAPIIEAEKNMPYLEEMRAFLKSVESGTLDPRAATFEDGVKALELAESIKRAAAVVAA